MKAFAFAVLIAASTLVACSDEKAPQDPTAPATTATTTKTTRSASVNASNASSVCKSYQKELASVEAQLQNGSSDELVEAKSALESMTADACN